MIKKVEIKNFRSFADDTVELHPEGVSLLVGGNNSGKSTFLYALSTWSYCCNVLVNEKRSDALLAGIHGDGYGVSLSDFTPLNIPSFKHLWTNLKVGVPYSLSITCYWDIAGVERYLTITLNEVQDKLFIKNGGSNLVVGDKVPTVAYLPSFAGLTAKEEWYSQASRSKYLGQGNAGAILRNQLMELYKASTAKKMELRAGAPRLKGSQVKWMLENDPFEKLNEVIYGIFKGIIIPEKFNEAFNTYVNINFAKVTKTGLTYKLLPGYQKRDIMSEGSGFLQWLSVYAFVLSPSIDVILLDEPDAHLHSTLQSVLMEDLCELADKFHKQVLLASHSCELIRMFDYSSILHLRGKHHKYLGSEQGKTRVLSGIGSEYFPRLEAVQKNKRVLFVENESDVNFLKYWCSKFETWPSNLVVWPYANKHRERTHLFLYLRDEIHGIKCMSLSDRDTCPKSLVDAALHLQGLNDNINPNGELYYRTWRRMEIESYLFCVDAIARAVDEKKGGGFAVRKTEVETYLNGTFGLVIPANIKDTASDAATDPFFDLDPKSVIGPLCRHYGIKKFDIAKQMQDVEIFDDVKTLINEIVAMCR
jgi:AAA15 family ATPase/GTPase